MMKTDCPERSSICIISNFILLPFCLLLYFVCTYLLIFYFPMQILFPHVFYLLAQVYYYTVFLIIMKFLLLFHWFVFYYLLYSHYFNTLYWHNPRLQVDKNSPSFGIIQSWENFSTFIFCQ